MKTAGFVDIQMNGYIGHSFSAPDLTLDKVRAVTHHLVRAGTAAYCPTVISSPMELYRRNLPILAEAMRDPDIGPHLLGLHIEGPFISPLEGARGAHPPDYIRAPDIDTLKRLQEWSDGRIAILTVAPEVKGALPLIQYAAGQGIVVSFGHHLADDAAMEAGVRAGARLCTHLGNGMPSKIDRHNNPIWWQLACDELSAIFIPDGHHLPADFIKVALRAKTPSRFIAVSDAAHLGGLKPGVYDFCGHPAVLEPSGRIGFQGTPYLAGSSATLMQCMNFLAAQALLTEAELWAVGRDNALRLLNRRLPDRTDGPGVTFRNGRFEI